VYRQTLDATIANGASLSGACDLGNARLSAIYMPSSWTTADLTFQASADGVTYQDLYASDNAGNDAEYLIGAGSARVITVPIADFAALRYLKVRSGTTGSAVAQGGARTITLLLAVL